MGAVRAWQAVGPTETASQFDFWLGEWDLAWGDGQRATNSVYRDFDDRVIVENFDGRPSLELQGTSLSTFDVDEGCWRQTWVDNRGSYLDFRGEFRDGQMDLRTERTVDGVRTLLRMRWFDISHDSLSWAWERSEDGGRTWESLWRLHYTRVV
jgi:hypothetical protein